MESSTEKLTIVLNMTKLALRKRNLYIRDLVFHDLSYIIYKFGHVPSCASISYWW
jgi:hypothetical protein